MKNLGYKHLDRKLSKLGAEENFTRPARGWLRAVREAIGMTTTQLAQRLNISQSSIISMEKSEQRGAISLETLERAARAMNCRVIYTLVPHESFEEIIHEQAEKKARLQLERINHSMRLENQAVSKKTLNEEQARFADELMQGNLHRLWDE
jgi:predicted DNA-binding mobile mystery protein A